MSVAKVPKKISVVFFKNDKGKMPVREWLLGFSPEDKKVIGEDIKTIEVGWPIGMPVVRPLGGKLFEVRSILTDRSYARVIFTIFQSNMVLLHGFFKTSSKTPKRELNLAKNRMKKFYENQKVKKKKKRKNGSK